MNKKTVTLIAAFLLALGIFGAGFSLSKALYDAKMMNRTVTVKGLTERNIKSDLGIWEIDYRVVGNDLSALNQQLMGYQQQTTSFLQQHGFSAQEFSIQPIKVEDKLANAYQSDNQNLSSQRYIVTGGIRVRSTRVDLIRKTSQSLTDLLKQGISLAFDLNPGNPNPSYYFTQLDAIRPSMLADATQSAREVALQFAKDAHTKLGGIQSASQGVFQIMDRDSSTMSADWSSAQSALGSIDKK
jgi:hypothetical protein